MDTASNNRMRTLCVALDAYTYWSKCSTDQSQAVPDAHLGLSTHLLCGCLVLELISWSRHFCLMRLDLCYDHGP